MKPAPPVDPGLGGRARLALAALTLGAFLLLIFLNLPANLLLQFLPSPLPAPWSTTPAGLSASGTVWQGELRGLRLGDVAWDSVRWELAPLAVVAGRLQGHVQATARGGQLETRFDLNFSGTGVLADVRGAFPLEWLQPAAQPAWRGQVRLAFANIALEPTGPGRFDGHAKLLGLASPAVAQALGDFRLDWPADSAQGRVASLRGPVELRAALLRQPGGGFLLEGEAVPRPDATPAVRQALGLFGPQDLNGRHSLRMEFGVSARP